MEIKTKHCGYTFRNVVQLSTTDLICNDLGDEKFKMYIPVEHGPQLLHQLVALCVHFALHVFAAESGIPEKNLV